MSFFSSISDKIQEAAQRQFSTVEDYLKTRVTDAVVKLGEAPRGNLTAEQIAQGMTGAPPPVVGPSAPIAAVGQANPAMAFASNAMPYLPIVLGAVVLGLFLMKKGK